MTFLNKDPKVVFIGEGLTNAGRIYGTMDTIPMDKCIEMPICENLIMGTAIGLALDGWKPVVIFQRMDFMLIAADQIINHLATMKQMSGGEVNPVVIIRAIIGSQSKKFWVGEQHNHDFYNMFHPYINTMEYIKGRYESVADYDFPVLIVEEKDKYEEEI